MTLPEPGAASPVPPDHTRLLDTFLARRSPRTLAAYQADFEDFRAYMRVATIANAAERLIIDGSGMAIACALGYRAQMIERGLPATTINRRLVALRSLVKLANTLGLVSWTLLAQSVENVPVQPARDTRGPGRDGALLRLLHDLGLRRSEAVRLD